MDGLQGGWISWQSLSFEFSTPMAFGMLPWATSLAIIVIFRDSQNERKLSIEEYLAKYLAK